MDTNDIKKIEDLIGYNFKNPVFLKQAFIRKSYANEHEDVLDNEVLEFYGDRALDYYVTKCMFKKFSSKTNDNQFYSDKTESELTRIKANNVDKENLSYCMNLLGLAQYLQLGSNDEDNDVRYADSVGEDLFEAIIGAVAVDSNWDENTLNEVCGKMLEISNFGDDYIYLIEDWCDKLGYNCYFRDYSSSDSSSVKQKFETMLYVGNLSFKGEGNSEFLARMAASEKAYKELYEEILISEVGNIGEDNPVVQLNKLYQKNYIAKPNYSFVEEHDDEGQPYWICKCKLGEDGYEQKGDGDNKKDSKKSAAGLVVEYLLTKKN